MGRTGEGRVVKGNGLPSESPCHGGRVRFLPKGLSDTLSQGCFAKVESQAWSGRRMYERGAESLIENIGDHGGRIQARQPGKAHQLLGTHQGELARPGIVEMIQWGSEGRELADVVIVAKQATVRGLAGGVAGGAIGLRHRQEVAGKARRVEVQAM